MAHHPDEPLVKIVGIEESSAGRSCEEHVVCGTALTLDAVVRFRSIAVFNGTYDLQSWLVVVTICFVFVY